LARSLHKETVPPVQDHHTEEGSENSLPTFGVYLVQEQSLEMSTLGEQLENHAPITSELADCKNKLKTVLSEKDAALTSLNKLQSERQELLACKGALEKDKSQLKKSLEEKKQKSVQKEKIF